MIAPEDMLAPKEAAALLHISHSTLLRWLQERVDAQGRPLIPHERLSRRIIRIPRAAIMAFKEHARTAPN